ncbi:MAG: riboflavin synthase [Flavobacteriales bacterium]
MFTGIVECLGVVENTEVHDGNLVLSVRSSISKELKIDQSLAHNGVCLTVVGTQGDVHQVVAIDETLKKTNLSRLKKGEEVNLERAMLAGGRLDGHIVQGHVDCTATCTKSIVKQGSWEFHFAYEPSEDRLTVPKGSICVNGVSLTVVDSLTGSFSVAIIPYTYEHTTFHLIQEGTEVNLEFDILGKYFLRYGKAYLESFNLR